MPLFSLSAEFSGILVLSKAQGIKWRWVYISFQVLLYAAEKIIFLPLYILLTFFITEPPIFSTLALPSVVTWHTCSVTRKIHCHLLYKRNGNGKSHRFRSNWIPIWKRWLFQENGSSELCSCFLCAMRPWKSCTSFYLEWTEHMTFVFKEMSFLWCTASYYHKSPRRLLMGSFRELGCMLKRAAPYNMLNVWDSIFSTHRESTYCCF